MNASSKLRAGVEVVYVYTHDGGQEHAGYTCMYVVDLPSTLAGLLKGELLT
jgi:hypothetical protein